MKPEVNECELNWYSFDGYSQTAYEYHQELIPFLHCYQMLSHN